MMELAVGAENRQRSWFCESMGSGGVFHTQSIMAPRKLVTVTPLSASQRLQLLALNFSRIT